MFRQGLNADVLMELACRLIHLDNLLQDHRPGTRVMLRHQTAAPRPMQTDSAHITPHECARRQRYNLCFYCGRARHFLSQYTTWASTKNCSSKSSTPAVSTCSFTQYTQFNLLVELKYSNMVSVFSALIDFN